MPAGTSTWGNYYQSKLPGYGKSNLFGNSFSNTPVGQQFLDNQPSGSFTRWLTEKGVPQHTKFGQWANSQYSDLRSGFSAAQADNPELSFYGPKQSYLNTIDLKGIYDNMSFGQKGLNPGLYAPRARMLPRGQ